MRGLKHEYIYGQNPRPLSHLLQMRGLKLIRIVIMVDQLKSHLLQMRGLKPRPSMDSHRQNQVASFTDAWIETSVLEYNSNNATNKSHLLQMRGLKPLFKGAFERVFNVASFTGTTIYNIFCKKITGLKYLFVRK